MWHLVTLGLFSLIAVTVVVAVTAYQQEQNNYERRLIYKGREPDISRKQKLGPCSHCAGNVNSIDGVRLPCGHAQHYRCMTILNTTLGSYATSDKMCKHCLPDSGESSRHENIEGLKHRIPISQKCVNCLREITESQKKLTCQQGHSVHEECFMRMKSVSTSCPECVDPSNE